MQNPLRGIDPTKTLDSLLDMPTPRRREAASGGAASRAAWLDLIEYITTRLPKPRSPQGHAQGRHKGCTTPRGHHSIARALLAARARQGTSPAAGHSVVTHSGRNQKDTEIDGPYKSNGVPNYLITIGTHYTLHVSIGERIDQEQASDQRKSVVLSYLVITNGSRFRRGPSQARKYLAYHTTQGGFSHTHKDTRTRRCTLNQQQSAWYHLPSTPIET